MVKNLASLAALYIKRAQALPSRENIEPIIISMVKDFNIPGFRQVHTPIDIQNNGEEIYVYFQIDVDVKNYDYLVETKALTYGDYKNRLEEALFHHFPLNRFRVTFGYFTDVSK